MIRGIDISHLNKVEDWSLLKKMDINFIFIKASEGVGYRDPQFYINWANAKKAGITRGAYHLFKPLQSGSEQAEAFKQVVGDLDAGDLPPVLDIESQNTTDDINQDSLYEFLTNCELWFEKKPIIYSSAYFLKSLNLNEKFQHFGLWIAEYGVSHPKVPKPWASWDFWQSTDHATISGVDGHVDQSYFRGSVDELSNFISNNTLKGD